VELTLTELDEREILRYLGCRGAADERTLNLVRRGQGELLSAIKPRFLYKVCSIFPAGDEDGVQMESGPLLSGQDIKRHLLGCDRVAVMACTISAQADALVRRWEAEDMAYALVLDACASAAVEAVCDLAEENIRSALPGFHFPYRFSPGYGDLPIALQNELLHLLDAPRRMGLCATDHHILTPRKSVTALLGIAQGEIERERRGCQSCNLAQRCAFRKAGGHCGTEQTASGD